jgi:hypothetical protein
MKIRIAAGFAAVTLVLAGCATLGGLAGIQPPGFDVAQGRQAELRVLGPGLDRPLGGASVRLWAHITNPNAFGITLAAIDGTFSLQDQRAAVVDFPLGLPLAAAADTVIPIDLSISFTDVPRLAEVLLRGMDRSMVDYRLDGNLRVDAGMLGQPTFGPMRLLSGELQLRR